MRQTKDRQYGAHCSGLCSAMDYDRRDDGLLNENKHESKLASDRNKQTTENL